MSNRLFVDLKDDCHGELTGSVKLPADGTFTLEALLTVVETFAASVGRPASEVLRDLYGHQLHREKEND